MSQSIFRSVAVLAASMFAVATAQAVVIDFEEFNAGQIIDSSNGVIISGAGDTSGGPPVIFDTDNITGEDTDLAAPFTSSNGDIVELSSPGNVLILHEDSSECGTGFCDDPDDDGNGGIFDFDFTGVLASGIILNSIDFFDIEASEAGAPITIELFMMSGSLTLSVPETGGDNTWSRLFFDEISGVTGMRVELNGSGAIDNLNFTIPLPGVAWLFFPGLAVLVTRVRRRQPQ